MGARVVINHNEIARMKREIQKSFDRNGPIRIAVEADPPALPTDVAATLGTTINYNGPVIHGDGAQVAYNNRDVTQTQAAVHQVASGFESVAQAVADVLAWLPGAGLAGQDREEAEQAGHEVLAEAVRAEPDVGKAKRALTMLKGLLSPIAIRVMTGAAAGAGTEAEAGAEKAVKAIEGLMKAAF